MRLNKSTLKNLLGDLPWVPEAYWRMRSFGRPVTAKFDLHRLKQALPDWCAQANAARPSLAGHPASVLLFGTLRYWLENVTALGLAFAGQGHRVTLAYLPYAEWAKPFNRFDARRQNAYASQILGMAEPLLDVVSLLNTPQAAIPAALADAIAENALRDTQYTLQVENVSLDSDLYQLRLERDTAAAGAVFSLMESGQPEIVVIPNGTILEFGAVYQTAKFLGVPVVTYEFGEQKQRLWLAQNAEVMRQSTDDLWAARQNQTLTEAQLEQARTLFAARQRATLWENFTRRWQGTPSEGGEKVRAALGLDSRPVVLLATNVIGDSLTLGRQVFSDSMTEWLERTVHWFAQHPEAQLVVRIHPGELITKGPSVADVVEKAIPALPAGLPSHIHLIPADAKVNTYDIVEIADLGLVYTTTVGMEMAMSGVPVIAVGNTHYRGKGFTLDANTWEAFFETLQQVLNDTTAYRLKLETVERAWNYAYRFFFEYPHPFPWHILHFWDDLKEWPLARVLSAEGQEAFGKTFRYLVGEPVQW